MSKSQRSHRAAPRAEGAERVEILRKGQELARADQTITRQAAAMAEHEASLTSLRSELNVSEQRATRSEAVARRQAQEIRNKDVQLALVLKSSVDGVLVYRSVRDRAGEIVDFECILHNPAAEQIYGIDCLEGKRLLVLHSDFQHQGMWNKLKQVAMTGEPFDGEYRYVRDGRARWFRVLAIQIEDGLALTFSDISERKDLEIKLRQQVEALARANQAKSEFLGVVSHELRTPVSIIMGFVGILEDELLGPLSEAQHGCLRDATKNTERLLTLINNMLEMRRIEAGELEVAPRIAAFPTIVEDVLANLAAAAAGHVLVNEVPPHIGAIYADPVRTAQVLTILVGNAVKFTAPGGTITVAARVRNGTLRCEVRDTGIGVADRDLRKLFRSFSQVDMSSTRTIGGAGLGLRIAKHLVETLGGRIGVKSRPDEGATFWFTLPTVARALAP